MKYAEILIGRILFFEGIPMVVNLKKIEIGDMDKIEELQDQINQMTLQVFLTTQVNPVRRSSTFQREGSHGA